MATQVQLRRGNNTQTLAFTGAVAEVTVDTDKDTVVVHDGSTAGGFPLAREAAANSASSYANSAFIHANAAFAYANTIVSDTQIDPYARAHANAAFDTANTAQTTATAAAGDGLAFAIALG